MAWIAPIIISLLAHTGLALNCNTVCIYNGGCDAYGCAIYCLTNRCCPEPAWPSGYWTGNTYWCGGDECNLEGWECVCDDGRTSSEVCSDAGAECGSVDDDCGDSRTCTNTCSGSETCVGTSCQVTADSCVPATGCQYVSNCLAGERCDPTTGACCGGNEKPCCSASAPPACTNPYWCDNLAAFTPTRQTSIHGAPGLGLCCPANWVAYYDAALVKWKCGNYAECANPTPTTNPPEFPATSGLFLCLNTEACCADIVQVGPSSYEAMCIPAGNSAYSRPFVVY